ncbi:porin family protein [Spirosoma gilvum]
MPELTDDQLDGLFRKSAEEFDPPFDPAAWQDMKARLDSNEHTMPAGALFWKNLLRWGLPVLLLLLLTGGGWLVYQKTTAKGTTAVDPARLAEAQPAKSAEPSPAHKSDLTITSSSDKKGNQVQKSADQIESIERTTNSEIRLDKLTKRPGPATTASTAPTRSPATNRATNTYKPVSDGRLSRPNRNNQLSAEAPLLATNNEAKTARYERTVKKGTNARMRKSRNRVISSEPVALVGADYSTKLTSPSWATKRQKSGEREIVQPEGYAVGGAITPGEEIESISPESFTVYKLAVRPPKWPTVTFATPPVVVHPDTTARTVVSKPSIPFQRGLSVRFGVSPDLSSVGLDNFSRPGTNIGAFLEYRFASRWSVQTGLIQSTKIYQAYPDEYDPPAGAWGGYTKPNNIDGRCNMFDIPLNVRYDFSVKPKKADNRLVNRWFVSTGVTSYIIKQEDYHYNYPAHTYNQRTDSTASTGGYGFSNLNFSVGYERALSRRLSWQIEPFIKMPLRGVGLFKIDLLSTGAFFSLRLKL